MGVEDRDYVRENPTFKFSPAMGPATKALLIVVAAGYLAGLVVADTVNFAAESGFWAAATQSGTQQYWARMLYVLTAADIAPWANGYAIGHWKILTSWIVAPGLITAVIDAIMVYFAGKWAEETLGGRRFLLLFIGACMGASLLAGLADPLLLPGKQQIVIMGAGPGILAAFTTMIWTAPSQPSIFGWPLKKVMIGLVIGLVVLNLVMPLFSVGEIALSPTHVAWGVAIGALYMRYMKAQGLLPSKAGRRGGPAWSQEGYLHGYRDEDPAREKQRIKEEKEAERRRRIEEKKLEEATAEQAKLDAILEKISRDGIGSLSRAERKYLDSQSKRKKDGAR